MESVPLIRLRAKVLSNSFMHDVREYMFMRMSLWKIPRLSFVGSSNILLGSYSGQKNCSSVGHFFKNQSISLKIKMIKI